jgi:glycosyltransferase involved in cell wall biosynthesis
MNTEPTKMSSVKASGQDVSTPKVSIGMPVYNGEPFIREALDSLLAQTFTDFELIISDNASTDGTEAICREYTKKDRRVRYMRQPENMGAVVNFQFVLDEAEGEYFMWAAADDIWEPSWVEILLPVSEKYQCLAYGTVVAVDQSGAQIYNPASGQAFDFSGSKATRRAKYLFSRSSRGKANPIYGLLPRSKMKNARFDILSEISSGSDMLFLFDLLSTVEIRRPNDMILHYKRIYEGCASSPPRVRADNLAGRLGRPFRILADLLFGPFAELGRYSRCATLLELVILLLMGPKLACNDLIRKMHLFSAKKSSGNLSTSG